MIRFYFHPAANPAKVALLLEEVGIDYESVPVDTSNGEQPLPAFGVINERHRIGIDTCWPHAVQMVFVLPCTGVSMLCTLRAPAMSSMISSSAETAV